MEVGSAWGFDSDLAVGEEVTKNDLSKAVYNVHGGLSRAEALTVVDLVFSTIRAQLVRGEKVLLTGFGCFRVVQRRDRR